MPCPGKSITTECIVCLSKKLLAAIPSFCPENQANKKHNCKIIPILFPPSFNPSVTRPINKYKHTHTHALYPRFKEQLFKDFWAWNNFKELEGKGRYWLRIQITSAAAAAFCRISYGTCAAILLGPTPRERILEDKIFMDIFMAYLQGMDAVFLHPEATALGAKETAKLLREKLLPPPKTRIFLFFFWMIIFHVPPWINPLAPSLLPRTRS